MRFASLSCLAIYSMILIHNVQSLIPPRTAHLVSIVLVVTW